jgi:hypothetical protein
VRGAGHVPGGGQVGVCGDAAGARDGAGEYRGRVRDQGEDLYVRVGGDKLWRPGIYEGRAACMSGAAYEVVYRYSDDMHNVEGGVQHEIREYIDEDQKEMNGEYLNGVRVAMKASSYRYGGGNEGTQCVVIFRYPDDYEAHSDVLPTNRRHHDLRKYPDHSFGEYSLGRISRVLTWRDLPSVQVGLDANESYEIECQDDIDPLRPEIRNYGVGGVDAQPVYQLWQLPPIDRVQIYRFNDKEQHTDIHDKQGAKQPELRWALRTAVREGAGMTVEDINKIRKQWQHKKEECEKYIAVKEASHNFYYEWNPYDLAKDWHEKIYQPSRSHITNLLQELYQYS